MVVGCFVDFIDLDQSLGVPSGFNLLSNLVPGPVKLWPGRWSSNGRLLTALLNKPLPDFTNCVYVFPQTAQVTFNITRPFFCDEMMQVICLCVSLTFNAIRHFLIWMIKMDIKDLTWERNFFKEIQQSSVSQQHSWNISRKISMWENDFAIEFSLKTRMARLQ